LVLGILNKKVQDLIGCDGFNVLAFEMGINSDQKKTIILDGIFFPRSFSGTP
jgi:hypothetical protein